MGLIVRKSIFFNNEQRGLMRPIIFCFQDNEVIAKAFSVNKSIAQELMKHNANQRTVNVENCFLKVLEKLPVNSTLKDFDILFNPEYKIDTLKILIEACKIIPFNIFWPGRLINNKLIYAEEGYADYKVFDVNEYDITCVF